MKGSSLVLLLAIVLCACAPAVPPTPTPLPPTAVPTQPPPTPTAGTEPDATMRQLAQAGGFSGAALVARDGQVLLSQGYGLADRAAAVANTPQTKFVISQLAEGFLAAAVLKLQEQGKLTVQDSICLYVADCPDKWKPVTLAHLLMHGSGIPAPTSASQTVDQMLDNAKTKPVVFAPGSYCYLSRLDYDLLSKAIEKAASGSVEAYLQQTFFGPLQMANTGFTAKPAGLALGYPNQKSTSAAAPPSQGGQYAAYSTIEDLYRWDQALFAGQVVAQPSLDTLLKANVAVPNLEGWSVGYGYMVKPEKPHLFELAGYDTGYASAVQHYPDDKVTIILLTNQGDLVPWELAGTVMEKLPKK